MLTGQYLEFQNKVEHFIPSERIITDYFRTLTYGTDASFYRLVPKIIIKVDNEQEVINTITLAVSMALPICFRGAGTSLSGQALTDSILISITEHWKDYDVIDNGKQIKMQCGVLGSEANKALAKYNTMLAPMPASIDAATVGGMAINNAAGMNSLDTYGMMATARFILLDGTVLDTGCQQSRDEFIETRPDIISGIQQLSQRLRSNEALAKKVAKKYQIKNTTGYSLRALLDFDDPIDIFAHLMIGSEGTLGFISEITHHTIEIKPVKASAFLVFPDIQTAGIAVTRFKHNKTPVSAAELIDYFSLKAVANMDGVPSFVAHLPEGATAILTQVEGVSQQQVEQHIAQVEQDIADLPTVVDVEFSQDASVYSLYWNIRKGIFPAVGANRPKGTTTLIEDVAFPIDVLSDALVGLQKLLLDFEYDDAVIYGHALDGNMHFIFSQSFEHKDDIIRYENLMEAVVDLVINQFDGSLKAEHGTGRNMAPFVAKEWGQEAYQLMVDIKRLFDPNNLLNPDVMLTQDAKLYTKNIKPMQAISELVDQCIECGFCERMCPSRNITLTPRQRIVGKRELAVLNIPMVASEASNNVHAKKQQTSKEKEFEQQFEYFGVDTCAGCGLCSTVCPIGINTGDLIREIRAKNNEPKQHIASVMSDYFSTVTGGIKAALAVANGAHSLVGTSAMQATTDTVRKISKQKVGKWLPTMPTKANKLIQPIYGKKSQLQVVYLPSCSSRVMGAAKGAKEQSSLFDKTMSLLEKAGYQVIIPEHINDQCCGMPFESKGMFQQADQKAQQSLELLEQASLNGKLPIYSDTSPCTNRLKSFNDPVSGKQTELKIYEPIEFIHTFLMDKLHFTQSDEKVACHITCSARRMGLEQQTIELMQACSKDVVIPEQITCCGWAGDKGFTVPELNASALKTLKPQVQDCHAGYSTSRTCEIGLSHHSGIDYQSIIYLVDKCTEAIAIKPSVIHK